MVFTRSGKSTIQTGSPSPFVHSQSTKISRRRVNKDNEESIESTKLFKINKNSNRLSHNHIRFDVSISSPGPSSQIPDIKTVAFEEPTVQPALITTPAKSSHKRECTEDNGKSVAPTSNKKLRSDTKSTPKRKSLTAPKSLRRSLSKHDIRILRLDAVPSAMGIKKLEISADEKGMNGAPEGDLYDVVLLADADLLPLELPKESISAFFMSILDAFQTLDSKVQWAKQYEITTSVRQIFLHHFPDVVSSTIFEESKSTCLKMILKLFLVNLLSLRSSNTRNAFLAIQRFFRGGLVDAFVSHENWLAIEEFSQIVQQLLVKSGNNPKFIAIESFQTLSVIALQSYPFAVLQESLFTEANLLNKNLEISGNCIQLFQEKLLKEFSNNIPAAQVFESFQKQNVMKLIYLSFSQAKKSQSKEKMRTLLRSLWTEQFQKDSERMTREVLSPYLLEAQVEEIKREAFREKEIVPEVIDENSQPNKTETKRVNLTAKPWKAVGSLPIAPASAKPSSFAAMRQQMKASMKPSASLETEILLL